MPDITLNEIVSIFFLAFALGMDAFSASMGLGMQEVRLKRIAMIGMVIGLFHIIMPSIGMAVGTVISTKIGTFTTVIGGLILVGIGAHMLFSAFNHEVRNAIQTTGAGLYIFAISVSIDSLTVGLGLGLSGAKTILVLLSFGAVSMVLTWLGMILGRKVHNLLGVYSEILGGSILFAFGLYILFA